MNPQENLGFGKPEMSFDQRIAKLEREEFLKNYDVKKKEIEERYIGQSAYNGIELARLVKKINDDLKFDLVYSTTTPADYNYVDEIHQVQFKTPDELRAEE